MSAYCSVHGKNRTLSNLIEDGLGGYKCAEGYECKTFEKDGQKQLARTESPVIMMMRMMEAMENSSASQSAPAPDPAQAANGMMDVMRSHISTTGGWAVGKTWDEQVKTVYNTWEDAKNTTYGPGGSGSGDGGDDTRFGLTKGKSKGKSRKGDWICPSCGNQNFSRRENCQQCGTSGKNEKRIGMKPGDWICPGCKDLVFSTKNQCKMCGTMKPADGSAIINPGGGPTAPAPLPTVAPYATTNNSASAGLQSSSNISQSARHVDNQVHITHLAASLGFGEGGWGVQPSQISALGGTANQPQPQPTQSQPSSAIAPGGYGAMGSNTSSLSSSIGSIQAHGVSPY